MPNASRSQIESRVIILALTIFLLSMILYTLLPVLTNVDVPFPPNAVLIVFAGILLMLYFFWLKVEIALVTGCLLLAMSLGSALSRQENLVRMYNDYTNEATDIAWPVIPVIIGLAFFVIHLVKLQHHDKIIRHLDPDSWALAPSVVIVFGSFFLLVESFLTEWAQQGAVLTVLIIVIDSILIVREMKSIRASVLSESDVQAKSISKKP